MADEELLGKPVTELNLSVRPRLCLERLGINTLGELVQRTGAELLEAKNFGAPSLAEIREKLARYGLSLRGE
jgi:DNA-directed RNA polymerase subunit alpha